LPENKCGENELKTFAYRTSKGNTYVRASCFNYKGNGEEYNLPVETLIAWYPLYFYYDWAYDYLYEKVHLNYYKGINQVDREFIDNNDIITFEDCLTFDGNYNFKTEKNIILRDNIILIKELNKQGFITFDKSGYSVEDVARNQIKVANILDAVWTTCEKRKYESKNSTEAYDSSYNEEQNSREILSYMTKDEEYLFQLMGAATKMNTIMSKVVHAKVYVSGNK